MPHNNDLQRYLDMFALSLSLKDSSSWTNKNFSTNHSTLFSIYLKMIEQDKKEFFACATDKEQIIHSLEKSKDFCNFTHEAQLLHVLQQLKNDEPSDFVLLPLVHFINYHVPGHVTGAFICKEDEMYKFFMVDKECFFIESPVSVVTIPPENLGSLCKSLLSNKRDPKCKEGYNILSKISKLSIPKLSFEFPYKLHPQKKEIVH